MRVLYAQYALVFQERVACTVAFRSSVCTNLSSTFRALGRAPCWSPRHHLTICAPYVFGLCSIAPRGKCCLASLICRHYYVPLYLFYDVHCHNFSGAG